MSDERDPRYCFAHQEIEDVPELPAEEYESEQEEDES
jgi:hypothetical protein